jgi:hypothetical protein
MAYRGTMREDEDPQDRPVAAQVVTEKPSESEQINELATALAKAQAELPIAGKDREANIKSEKGASYKYSYATLAACWAAWQQAGPKHGLALIQKLLPNGSVYKLETKLVHTSGQWIRSELRISGGATPQALGGLITYMRRYSMCALVGIVQDDDDAAEAEEETRRPPPCREEPRQQDRRPPVRAQQQPSDNEGEVDVPFAVPGDEDASPEDSWTELVKDACGRTLAATDVTSVQSIVSDVAGITGLADGHLRAVRKTAVRRVIDLAAASKSLKDLAVASELYKAVETSVSEEWKAQTVAAYQATKADIKKATAPAKVA